MKTRLQRAGDWAANAAYLLAAIACFGLSIYSILLDRAGSAGVAATFAVAFLFLRHLPVIESFKAFNMEAKFARRVDEFDKLLAYIRAAAEVTSRLLYLQLAYSGRMASIDWGRKREFIEELDRNLVELGVDSAFIKTAKRPILNFASWDLYRVFSGNAHVLSERLRHEIAQAQHAITKGGPINPSDTEWNELHQRQLALIVPHPAFGDMSGPTPLEDIGSVTGEVLGKVPYPPRERALLEQIAHEIEALAVACWEGGTVTVEAQSYIERYGRKDGDRLSELEESAAGGDSQ
jgi:hypothetical protein